MYVNLLYLVSSPSSAYLLLFLFAEKKEYELDITFFKPVDAEGSTYKVLPRSIQMHVMKKEKDESEFWPRLLKDKALEKNQVSTIEGLAFEPLIVLDTFILIQSTFVIFIYSNRSKLIGIGMWTKMRKKRALTHQR